MFDLRVPLQNPRPDCDAFLRAVTTPWEPDRPRLVEYLFNPPLMKAVLAELGREWVEPTSDTASQKAYWDNAIAFWHHMGYDYVRIEICLPFSGLTGRKSEALHRNFEETHGGPIQSWEDFEAYPWPDPAKAWLFPYEYVNAHLPEGMGLFANHGGGPFEWLSKLMGYEALCMALFDDPDLVAAIANKIGSLCEAYYAQLLQLENLRAVFPGDDMGFRSGTMIAPDDLRKYTLPWHKRYAQMTHDRGLPYFLHSCGKIFDIVPDLIDDIGIQAKHSYEDAILPASEFKKRYGDRIGVLGGVDVDKLTRLSAGELRSYVRGVIDACAPGGRFAVGSGNSIPDYIPIENYLTMIDEALR